MDEKELKEIEERAKAAQDVPRLIEEIRRLREGINQLAYLYEGASRCVDGSSIMAARSHAYKDCAKCLRDLLPKP